MFSPSTLSAKANLEVVEKSTWTAYDLLHRESQDRPIAQRLTLRSSSPSKPLICHLKMGPLKSMKKSRKLYNSITGSQNWEAGLEWGHMVQKGFFLNSPRQLGFEHPEYWEVTTGNV